MFVLLQNLGNGLCLSDKTLVAFSAAAPRHYCNRGKGIVPDSGLKRGLKHGLGHSDISSSSTSLYYPHVSQGRFEHHRAVTTG